MTGRTRDALVGANLARAGIDRAARVREGSVVILGAGFDQVFAIETARSMGLGTIAVDVDPQAPGFEIADTCLHISNRDIPAMRAALDALRQAGARIAGVLVMGTDIPQVGVALSEHLGTPAISMTSALLATNKLAMKTRFAACDVPVPWFSVACGPEDVSMAAKEHGLPLVMKPVDRSGARGVFLLEDLSDLDERFAESRSESLAGDVMIEAFIEGPQVSTESIMLGGKAHTPGFADRNYEHLRTFAPRIIENGASAPSVVSAEDRRAVEDVVERAALALGITDGPVKGDIVLGPDGPYVIEMAARLSGGDFCAALIPLGTGLNLVEISIKLAIGEPVSADDLTPDRDVSVASRYFLPPPGTVASISVPAGLREEPWLRKLELWYEPGDVFGPIRSHADRFGVFVVDGDRREEVAARIEQVYRSVEIVTEARA